MKRALAFCLALAFLALSAGCGAAEEKTVAASVTQASAAYDLDLTKLSSTMVYSEVSQIMSEPENYIGKTIRAKGTFRENKGYYFVLISDATACCGQGIEFTLSGNHTYPKDYPPLDTEIIVAGTFNSYLEDDLTYYHIENATLETA